MFEGLFLLCSNRCAALLKLSKVSKAMADADLCINLKPEWEKGYFRKACTYELTENYSEALEWYQKAAECNPDNGEVATKIRNLTRLLKSKSSGGSTEKKVEVQNGK